MPGEYRPEIATATIQNCRWEDPPSLGPSSLFVGHFIVAFSYVVDGVHHSGEFYSSRAWKDGAELLICYNPHDPEEHSDPDDHESQTGATLECILEWISAILSGGPTM